MRETVFRVREYRCAYTVVEPQLRLPVSSGRATTIELAAAILRQYTDPSPKEQVWVLHLDTQVQIVGAHLVSIGGLVSTLCHPRDVFREALYSNAYAVLMGHNHPSGSVSPSDEDVLLTDAIARAGDVLQIPLYDHLIVAPDGSYYSFRQNGRLT